MRLDLAGTESRSQPLNQRAQLAHIAGPGVVLQQAQSDRRELHESATMEAAGTCQKMRAQRRNVAGALAKRWYDDGSNRQPVVKILAERPIGNCAVKVAAAERDHSHVVRNETEAPVRLETSFLDRSQQPQLDRKAERADLVEHKRAVTGGLKPAPAHACPGAEPIVSEKIVF